MAGRYLGARRSTVSPRQDHRNLPAFVSGAYLCVWALTARLLAASLTLIGLEGRAEGTLVTSSIYSAEIIWECTGVTPILVFVAAVAAYPSVWHRKVYGVLLGVPALLVINQVRLVSLFYVGHWFPEFFDTAHLLVWQSLIIFFTVMVWVVWMVTLGRRDETQSA